MQRLRPIDLDLGRAALFRLADSNRFERHRPGPSALCLYAMLKPWSNLLSCRAGGEVGQLQHSRLR